MARRQLNIAEAMKLVLQDSQEDLVESESEGEDQDGESESDSSDCHPSFNDNNDTVTVAETETESTSTPESVDNTACNGEIIPPTVLESEDACKHEVAVEDNMMLVPDSEHGSDLLTIAENGGAGNCLQEFDSHPTTTTVTYSTLEDAAACSDSVAVEEVAEMLVSPMPDQLNNGPPTNDQLMASENGDDDVSISSSMDVSTASQVATDTSTVDFSEDPERLAVNKRKATPALWMRNVQKNARLGGHRYTNTKQDTVPERQIRAPCKSTSCTKSSLRHCESFLPEERNEMFHHFWAMCSWSERKTFLRVLISMVDKKQFRVGQCSQRTKSYNYFLMVGGVKRQVCKSMLVNTLGISSRTLSNWLEEDNSPGIAAKQPKNGPSAPVSVEDKLFLKNWLQDVPTVPSHYCRQAYPDTRFIFHGKSISSLQRDYAQDSVAAGKRSVGLKYFTDTFHSMKMAFHHPRKDRCDTCVSREQGNISDEIFQLHVIRKDCAQTEKANDKVHGGIDRTTSVWTMDMQAVMTCPKTSASALYYKTKLAIHNMTYYNLITKEGFCYLFDEAEGDLSSEMFGSFHNRHFKKYLTDNPHIKSLIIWSDGCGYQNKCSTVSNCLIKLSEETGVCITQKYLVPGHTQMECDSMHSTIERKMSVDLFIPHDFSTVMRLARQSPQPYSVHELTYQDSKKLSSDYVKSIRPGRRTGDPKVSDVCAYRYTTLDDGSSSAEYLLNWGDSWTLLPCRVFLEDKVWRPLFSSRLPIKRRKYDDLQAMFHVLPECAKSFYDQLPHK